MTDNSKLPIALLAMRASVFLVMLVWTLDKFVRPEHASTVYEHFYLIGGLGSAVMYAVGALELLILLAFLLGILKLWSYGAILAFHAVSTLSSFSIYLDPFADGPNLLFFAAWPMLAACFALFVLREQDTLCNFGTG